MENFKQTTCLPLLRSSYNGLNKSEQKLAEKKKKKTLHENLIKEFLKDAEYGCSDGGYYASWKNTKRCYKGTETPIRSFRYGKGEAAV